VADQELSGWYELVEGRDLQQGDILEGCPVFRVPTDLPAPIPDDVNFEVGEQDVVVTSQSCDLVEGQKGIEYVALAPMWSLTEITKAFNYFGSTYVREMCRRGHMPGHHMLAPCEHEDWEREIAVVSFREVHSLPIDFLRAFADQAGPRMRVRSPYREHLAQAYARYYMRVGLPVDIAGFQTEKDVRKAIERLEALEPDEREQAIQAVQQ
jgi:hypothetical protein